MEEESRILIWLWDTISQRLDTYLPEDKRKDIKRIVQDQYDRYDWPGRPFAELQGVSYSLTLRPGVVPSYQPLRMLSPEQKIVVQNYIHELLATGIVERYSSPWQGCLVLVRKKDGKDWRIAQDFRELNLRTVIERYPLPLITQVIHALSGTEWFSSLDIKSAF